ncbi:hypothetical protein Cni_G26742 [Canna indica]|uniref:Uncharacterized protein n=1 Tax=Canna indica TaxID=4628 RepID=A0AAQ3L0C9_9LILI|nr:hypothetical protein Cni_G26742 [Canna indica]
MARSMNEEEWRHVGDDVQLQDLWVFLNQQLGGNRYLLILNDFEFMGLMNDEEQKDKWDQLKHILLRVGGPGSTVIITGGHRFSYKSKVFKLERISEKAWVELLLRHALMIQPDQDTKEAENYGRKLYGKVHTQPSPLDAKCVRLVNLKRCERLPPLGLLPNLENVEISGMDLIEVVDDSFYGKHGEFYELRKITFSEMPKLEKWLSPTETQEDELFPNLNKLTVIQCPKFKQLDVHLWRLRELKLWMNNEMMFTSEFVGWHKLENADYLEVIGCQELRCLPQSMHQKLVNLRRMNILSCHNLISLPDWLPDSITKCIEDCPN